MSSNPSPDGDWRGRMHGIAFMLVGITLFAWHDALNKWLVTAYFVYQLLLLRSVFSLVPVLVLVRRAGVRKTLKTRKFGPLLFRSFLLFMAFATWVGALDMVPLADMVAVGMAMPLVVTAFGALLLGESVDSRRWAAIFAGFFGVLLIVGPSGEFPLAATMLAMSSVVFFGMAFVRTRRLGVTESAETMVLYQVVFNCIGSGLVLLVLPGKWLMPSAVDWGLFAAVGLCAGLAQFCMTSAFRAAPLSVVAPFEYFALVWAVILGYVVWSDIPDLWSVAGALIVVASGLYTVYREAALRRAASGRPP